MIKIKEDPNNQMGYKYPDLGFFFAHNPSDGATAYVNTCRERFASNWKIPSALWVGFGGVVCDLNKVREFFADVEGTIGLKTHSVFHETDSRHHFICEPSPFWFRYWLRRQVFTMLLRCAALFYKGERSRGDALLMYGLTKNTINAIGVFISGMTTPIGYPQRWQNSRNPVDLAVGFFDRFQGAEVDYVLKELGRDPKDTDLIPTTEASDDTTKVSG